MLIWAVHDGGYDADTWYWGALLLLALVAGLGLAYRARVRISRAGAVALGALVLYVAWSYLSITWAESPGNALEGSNRALLYLLVFGLMLVLPWTAESALVALLCFAIGIGTVALVLLVRLASASHVASLVIQGRLAAPTGYFNSTAALFTMGALVSIVLAVRRELPALLRALLIGFACAELQLGLIVQSRGWLFTLPLVALAAIVVVPDRLRTLLASVLPVAAVLIPLKRLLHVYQAGGGRNLPHDAAQAGKAGLLLCLVMFVVAALLAWGERRAPPRELGTRTRRALGIGAAVLVLGAVAGGGLAATHGRPFHFISREWRGLSHPQAVFSKQSHFLDVGSGRYDAWRVALDAFVAHPIGGLGQDNYADYYITHRHGGAELSWTHSLELRLLAHTGIIGTLLFVVFIAAALLGALRARRRGRSRTAAVAAAALLPLLVWLIHGSVDWFWEMPALSGPALGFLGLALALDAPRSAAATDAEDGERPAPRLRLLWSGAGVLAFLAAFVALALPYLSVREVSIASDVQATRPQAALSDLAHAADLNPLSSIPGQLGGTIALRSGDYADAERRFDQAIDRERQAWYPWLGAGLAASALGAQDVAHHDFVVAASINTQQPAVAAALARVYSAHPLTPEQAFRMFVTLPL